LTKFLKIDELIDTLTEYIKIKLELIKLNMVEELSEIIAQVIALFLILTVFMFFLAFGSITLSTFLNYIWGSSYLGYGAVTGVYLVILLFFVYLLRSGKLKEAVEVQISKNMKRRKESLNDQNHE
jgi:uncharacterized membrane protein YqjE